MLYLGLEAALGCCIWDGGCCIWEWRQPSPSPWAWLPVPVLSVPCPFQTYMLHDSLEHAQLFDLMRRMLEFDPSQRITFSQALLHPFFAGLSAEERMLCGRGTSRDLSR